MVLTQDAGIGERGRNFQTLDIVRGWRKSERNRAVGSPGGILRLSFRGIAADPMPVASTIELAIGTTDLDRVLRRAHQAHGLVG